MIIQIISLVLLSIVTVVLLIDIVPISKDWLSRIHIGRYQDKHTWNKSITNIGVKWLNTTPKIKVTDNIRLVAIDMLKGNYSKCAIQHWQEASLLLGLSEYLKNNDDKEVKQEIMKFMKSKFDRHGQWNDKPKNVDAAILAYAIMKLDFIDKDRYKAALDYTWDLIKEHLGHDGTVEYRKFMKSYRYVDTIGFICPFLVAYGTRYSKDECVDLAVKQIKAYEEYGMLEGHYIPTHAYQLENKVPLGLYGWGRGLGWFAIGLIDAWNELPKGHTYKPVLELSVKKFAKSAMVFQQEHGTWNWTVTRGECRPDSSATATLGWFMLNASKIEGISEKCLESADKAIHYLMRATRRDGAVDFSQGDTKDIGVYSMLFNILPFTQGLCIRIMNSYNNPKVV
ncbi:glycoside hydrolase family 88 protein [Paenibacillus sp. GP183]|uniref:glycoside hydrolase family 88 protein n=1 Tax=Paenibacillus sp. GP183 TaxID=1882751 RepID=UPI00089CA396|nr:glycoside hydrolase family 88 protein [Paenibacillus sp. GP183]SEC07432.1 unsaturated rhamnogalacturonyl hydrolase [Paenibacillus sp. GP183]